MARLGGHIAWELEIPSMKIESYRDTLGPGRKSVAEVVQGLLLKEDALAARNLAIIGLLFNQGLRRGEVAGLDLGHLDAERGRLSILGKGRSGREWVTLARGTCDYLARWLSARGTSPGPLFSSLDRASKHGRLSDTSIYRIAADHFPTTKVLATGSSTLEASTKFRDTLSGRKTEIRLTTLMTADLQDFGNEDLDHRLARGGLPPFFLNPDVPESDFQEWMDSYWAKDIQELFRLERRAAFHRFLELLFVNSGGIFEATKYAAPCEISRPTVTHYLQALEATRVAHVIRPFSSRRSSEIISAPKVYTFDTGFVRYFHGWGTLRPEDNGVLWEHLVLNEIQSHRQDADVRYWRDKLGHEVDFVIPRRGKTPIAIECKGSSKSQDPRGLRAFRRRYPGLENWRVAQDVDRPFVSRDGEAVDCIGIKEFATRLGGTP